jgi:tetratricopeptide (TPR) repeat protein
MIRVPLRLTRSLRTKVWVPAAWFIPGDDPAVWLEELSRWVVPISKAKLFVLPSGTAAQRPSGVLVTVGNAVPRETLRAEAYGCTGGKLYFPLNARLEPAVDNVEIERLAPCQLSVFHPGVGLVGFTEDDGLNIAGILVAPPRRACAWDRAQPGASPYPRLVSVEPDVQLSLEEVLQAGRGDIGSKAPQELPPSRGELGPVASLGGKALIVGVGAAAGIASVIGGMAGAFSSVMGGLGGLGGLGGGNSGSPAARARPVGRGFLDGFKDWARAWTERMSEQLENARSRELQRLIRMLDDDPESGLSYAIPLAGKAGAPRGVSPPGASLTRRPVNFNLSSLGGGGAVDYWGMDERVRAALRQKYIAAANRELSLGRFRRAAYIFAELLGDHDAAANALKQGRHFREAAVIYRDVLKNKGLAAECLEEGGLIAEAIALRKDLKQWLNVARLYEKIESPEEARKAYRLAVDECLGRKELTAAADILSQRMEEHDEALQVLASGWPGSVQSAQCLTAQFALLGKLGRHRAAVGVVRSLRTAPLVEGDAQTAVEVCSKLTSNYPDASLREFSADMARIIAGERMARATHDRVRPMALAVAALAPEDRLLARDANRYIETRRAKARVRETPSPFMVKAAKPRLIRTIQLGREVAPWSAASSCGGTFFAASTFPFESDSNGLIVVRGSWTGELQSECWANVPASSGAPIRIEASRRISQEVLLGPFKSQRVPMRTLAACAVGPGVKVGTPDWMPMETSSFCYDEQGTAYVVQTPFLFNHKVAPDCSVNIYSVDGKLQTQLPIELELVQSLKPWPIVVRHQRIFISNGESGMISLRGGKSSVLDLGRPIVDVVASAPFTRMRIAVAHDDGGVVLWPDSAEKKQCRFGQGMQSPVIGFTRGGDLVAATKSEVRVYRTESESLGIACSVNGPGDEPYAVLPADGVDEYALFLKNGDVQVWHV